MHDLLASTRRSLIAERLDAGSSVVATSLAAEFGVSEDAIRRDLRALATEGRCRRTYGGALPISPVSPPMVDRAAADRPRKCALAEAAVRLVQPAQVLFLDSGSTNLALAPLLADMPDLTVATNSVLIAAAFLRRTRVRAILIGGVIDAEVGGCVDAGAAAEMRRLRFDLCFLGACALSRQDGVTVFHHADAAFMRELLPRSRAVVAMLTTEKLETRAPFGVADLVDIDHLIVEHDVPAAMRARLAAAGPEIVVAEPPR